MFSSQHIIEVKKSGLTDTAPTYRCIVLSNGSTSKLNNAALESVGGEQQSFIFYVSCYEKNVDYLLAGS